MKISECFREIEEKTKENHQHEIMSLLEATTIDDRLMKIFSQHWIKNENPINKCSTSLLTCCDTEVCRISGQIAFLTANGLYRCAESNIRFMLEMSIQAFYIDSNHPDSSLETKLEIFKEVQGKKPFRAANLIDNLKAGKKISAAYRNLVEEIHVACEKEKTCFFDIKTENDDPAHINPDQIITITNHLTQFYDIFYTLFFTHFNECLPNLKTDKQAQTTIKQHNLQLINNLINKNS